MRAGSVFHGSLDRNLAWRREVVKTSVRALLPLAIAGRAKRLTEI
jgi:hypothetical protein